MVRVRIPRSVVILVTLFGVTLTQVGCDKKKSNVVFPQNRSDQKQEKPGEEEGVLSALSLTAKDRQLIFEDLKNYLKANYTFQKIKPMGLVSIDKILTLCAAEEVKNKTKESPYSNLEFEDRLLRCIALIGDGHLLMKQKNPKVVSGIVLKEIKGKFFVSAIYANKYFLAETNKRLGKNIVEILGPGTEVLAIDGKAPAEISQDLGLYIAASSAAYREELAVQAITERDFRYPEKKTFEVKYFDAAAKESRTVELPWYYDRAPYSTVHRLYLAEKGIRPIYVALNPPAPQDPAQKKDADRINPNDVDRKRGNWLGYLEQGMLPLSNMVEFTSPSKEVILRFATADIVQGTKACYLQLLDFKTEEFHGKELSGSFEYVFGLLLKACESQKSPLILDLRYNEGGDPETALRLMRMLAKPGSVNPPMYYTGLATKSFLHFNSQWGFAKEVFGENLPVFHNRLRAEAADKAAKEKLEYLPLVPSGNILPTLIGQAPGAVVGFSQKLILLVTPQCFSACDIFAEFVQNSGRGIIIGTQTSGAFGTMLNFRDGILPKWTDQKHRMFSLQVPNAVTGVLDVTLKEGEILVPFKLDQHMPEGRPVKATQGAEYAVELADLAGKKSGWISKALSLLGADAAPAVVP